MYVYFLCQSIKYLILLLSVHNWYDVVIGGIIGTLCALVAFRQTFAAIVDFRFNHILLPRATSLFHRQPYLPFAGRGPSYAYQPSSDWLSHDLPFTREGGWNHGGGAQYVGAPGDATVLLSGAGHTGNMTGGMGNMNGGMTHMNGGTSNMNGGIANHQAGFGHHNDHHLGHGNTGVPAAGTQNVV